MIGKNMENNQSIDIAGVIETHEKWRKRRNRVEQYILDKMHANQRRLMTYMCLHEEVLRRAYAPAWYMNYAKRISMDSLIIRGEMLHLEIDNGVRFQIPLLFFQDIKTFEVYMIKQKQEKSAKLQEEIRNRELRTLAELKEKYEKP